MRVVGWPELPEELPGDDPEEPLDPLVRVVGALPLEPYPDEEEPEEYEGPALVRVTGAPEEPLGA